MSDKIYVVVIHDLTYLEDRLAGQFFTSKSDAEEFVHYLGYTEYMSDYEEYHRFNDEESYAEILELTNEK